MQNYSALPDLSLQHIVKEFSFTNISANNLESNTQIVIDDGCYDFAFFNGEEITFTHNLRNNIKLTNSVYTIHQLKPPFRVSCKNQLQVFVIKVQPWANALFFPASLPAGVIDLKEIYPNIGETHEGLFSLEDFQHKILIAETFLQSLDIAEDESFKLARNICEKIYESKGSIKVNELETQFNISRQLLNKKFKKQVHYTIKQFSMIVRIMDLVKYKIDHQDSSLTTLAHQFNYTDQAHFINDFKKVCGVAPLNFFKDLPVFFERHKK